MTPPNGFFVDDLLVYNDLDSRGAAAMGFHFDCPDLRNASRSLLLQFKQATRTFLRSLDMTTHLKIHWSVDSNYQEALLSYGAKSESVDLPWVRRCRDERFKRYWSMMEQRKLRREITRIYISKKITANPPANVVGEELQEHYQRVAQEMASSLRQHGASISSGFSSLGCRVTPMQAKDHFLHMVTALNPSLNNRIGEDLVATFDPLKSIQQNCLNGKSVSGSMAENKRAHYFHDGYWHNIVVLKKDRPPQTTEPGIIWHLTNLPFLDYEVTVTIRPLDPQVVIKQEENLLDRIKGEYAAEGRESDVTKIDKKKRKVRSLTTGEFVPFEFEFAVHIWARTQEELISKTDVAKQAYNRMAGAQYYEIAEPSTIKHLMFNLWPGYTFTPYTHYYQYSQDDWLADLLPFSSSFVGHLNDAEALYDGENGSLVGIRTFIDGTPQLAACMGMTRVGKSAQMCDLLTQTAPYFDYDVIIEEGLSYGIYTQLCGEQPIIIRPDSEFTFNYLDTQALPLTGLHKSSAVALISKMAGTPSNERELNVQNSQLAEYVEQLYQDFYDDWVQTRPETITHIARSVILVSRYQKAFLPPGSTFLEAHVDCRDLLKSGDARVLEMADKITEQEITTCMKDQTGERLIRDVAFSLFTPDQYPTHSALCEMMRRPMRNHNKEQIHVMQSLLESWRSYGTHGKLVDGASNFSLGRRISHFEMGYIPESAKELKVIANFLVANYARQHILTLPRGKRKRVIFEEVARTLDIPGGDTLVSEFYAQLSKFNCWIISIVQQYSRFKHSRIRPIIMGNSSMFFFLKMNDRGDLDDLGKDIDLPEVTKSNILNFPRPADLPANNKYSSMSYYHLGAQRPLCGTVFNRSSSEMLYVSSSTGEDFDRRATALKQHTSVLAGVIAESSKP